MSNYSDSLLVVAEAIYNSLNDNKEQLGLKEVWYDIEGMVPTTPSVIVEPQSKSRALSNTGHMVENTFQVSIILLHSRMASKSVTNAEALEFAETIEAFLHQDKTLGGHIIHGHVTEVQQGSVNLQKVLLRATALSWRGMSKTRI